MWIVYALLSALFAALTAILAKIGMKGIDSDLATAIRTVVILAITWGIVLFGNHLRQMRELTRENLIFLVLSGVATGLSWLFYFKALQIGEASKVVPIDKLSIVLTLILAFFFLHEQITPKVLAGGLLITAGAIVIAW